MADLNKVILMGHMTADPELKQTTSGISVCSFSIGVNRRYSKADQGQQSVDFINIVSWRQQAEFVAKYFTKGRPILVCGSLQTRSWTDQNGQKRYATDIVAEEVSFVDSRSESSSSGQYVPDSYNAEPSFSGGAEAPKFEEIKGDDDLPF